MKEKSKKIISIVIVLFIVLNYFVPVINYAESNTKEETEQQTETEEIGRVYEIKETEEWDISENGDKSVIAEWNLVDKSITISGKGNMKDWNDNYIEEDWHGKYKKVIEKVVINDGITNIGNYAFDECSSLKKITIPNSVTIIGRNALFGCSSLKEIIIPNGVTSIEINTYSKCSSLEKIIIPNSVTSIGVNPFSGCSSLKEITIPSSVTRIRECAFNGCSGLEKITIPSNVTSIGDHMFSYCSSLKEITIPNSVTSIGWCAFIGCSSLKEITIPSSVKFIDDGVFEQCDSLEEIKVSSENKNFTSVDGVLYNKNKTKIIAYPANKQGEKYSIPSSVKSIGMGGFYGSSNLKEITIPSSTTSIGSGAFSGCSSLKEITIPNSVTSLERNAFSGCSSLKEITIPSNVTSIEDYAFKGCSSLKEITIPNSVTSIEWYAFSGCSSLEKITIPSSVTSIGKDAFDGIKYITCKTNSYAHKYAEENKINYKLSDNKVSQYADVYEIKQTEEWDISENGDKSVIAKWNYTDKSITISGKGNMKNYVPWQEEYKKVVEKLVINNGITNIGTYAFFGCSSLKEIIIPNSVTKIEFYAFSRCSSLKEITIPSGVTSIGSAAFEECSSLKKITIPNSVTSIEGFAFSRCSDLKEITIPSSVKFIDDVVFEQCDSLEEIKVSSENKNFTSVDGVLYNKNKTKIIAYPANKSSENYIILNSVTSIGCWAFVGCSSLKEITIPSSVTSIGCWAFIGCSSLKEITIPSSTTSIGSGAFVGCSSLKEITIPNSVTSLERDTFSGCSSLKEITIPSSTTSIGSGAFSGCSSLKEITIPNSVTSLERDTFSGCSSLKEITISDGVKSIGSYAFSGCSSLEEIIIPDNVTSIGERAFYGVKYIMCEIYDYAHKYAETNKIPYILDKNPPKIEVNYSTTLLTNKNVIASILSNVKIQNISGWTLSADKKTLTKEYEKNTEEEIIIRDFIGNEVKQTISVKNIDKDGPEINLSIYSAIKPNSNLEINLNVTDELSGVNEKSICYIWSKEKDLNKKDITNKIENNKIIKTPENVIDTYYLYIYAEDKVGNETIYRSKEFNLDYTRNENIVFADKLVTDATDKETIENNRIYLQSLVDKASEDGGGIVHIPSGTYYFSGNTEYYTNSAVGIVCKDNVSIEGEGIDVTILKPYGEYLHGMNMFHYTDQNKTYLVNADFRNFTIDSINETSTEYNYQGKGFMLSFTKDCDFENVKVVNTDGTGFGVNFPINCTIINCYAKGCGKAGKRTSSGSSGFGIETGYSNDESIIISDCKAYENTKYGFVFEHQSIFYENLKELEYKATSSNGFVVMNCVAQNNLYDYGGIRAYDLVYENCVSSQPTKVLTDKEGNIYNNKGINFENFSKRVSIINCVLEDEFADVFDKSKSYYEPVYWAYNSGIVDRRIQDGKNVFKPYDSATRGVVASFLYKYMNRPGEIVNGKEKTIKSEVLKTSFADVSIDDYYYEPVEWLNSKKIINTSGTDTEFKPAEICTRAMFITFLYRLAGNPQTTAVNKFEDVGNEGKWYQKAVDWGVSRGIIDDSNTKFFPDEGISRADIVTFLYKYENSKNTNFNNKYYLTGGKLLEANQETYTSGVSEFAINNPTKEGYNFIGWTGSNIVNFNTLNIEPQENISITKENVGNNVYTANWRPIEYKINYIANNGTNKSKIQNFTYNASQKIIKNDFVKEGYVFKEWNTKEDGSGTSYSEDKVVNNLSNKEGKTIKLYAQWKKIIIPAIGDVTQDGVVNIGDLLKLKQHMAQQQSETTRAKHPDWKLDEEKILMGDVNKNGKIDVGDILKIQRYIAATKSKEIAERHSDWLNL